ncbi:MAG: hypothetical protein ACKOGA_11830 [Planctomycetaceae bacterium]
MWLTETAWPPAIVCCLGAIAWAALWGQRNLSRAVSGALVGLLAAGLCFVIERQVVTAREQVEQRVAELVENFEQRRRDQVVEAFSPQAAQLRKLAGNALDLVTVRGMKIKDLEVELVSRGTEAVSHFRANGQVVFMGNDAGHRPSRWKLVWRREEGTWRIVDVIRLNPLRDEPMEILGMDGD